MDKTAFVKDLNRKITWATDVMIKCLHNGNFATADYYRGYVDSLIEVMKDINEGHYE